MLDAMLSLVLPVYNRKLNFDSLVAVAVAELPKFFARSEIIIVSDSDYAQKLVGLYPNVQVIQQPNRDYGAALSTGFRAATGDYLMFMDSDWMADVARLVSYLGKADIIAGYRTKGNNLFYNRIIALLFGVHLRDVNCASKIFKSAVLQNMELTTNEVLINLEILAKAQNKGCSVIETGVNSYPDVHMGRPNSGLGPVIEIYKLWLHLQQTDLKKQNSKPFPSINMLTALLFSVVLIWVLFLRSGKRH